MNLSPLIFVVPCSLLMACGPPASDRPKEQATVETEKRSDGLVYAKKSPHPFSGEILVISNGSNRQSVETYWEGKPHGSWLRYWANGRVKREQQWVHGSQIHQRQWFEDGTLKEDLKMKDGQSNGRIRMWWPDGRLRRTAFVGNDLRPHGHSLEYAPDGTVVVDAIFHHGKYVSGLLKQDVLASKAGVAAE